MEYSNTMKEFYEDHGLSESRFASLIEVAPQSLRKYACGTLVDETVNRKIEIGIQVVEDYGMRFPNRKCDDESWLELREPDKYERRFKTIYNKILLAEL